MRARMMELIAGVAFLVGIGWMAGCYMPEPTRFDPVSGEQKGMGVAAPAKIVRDQNGVVHITAANEEDLFFAIGYAQAQDRFSMMDLLRRAGSGRLSEFLGSPGKYKDIDLPHLDLGLRAFRFEEAAKQGVAELTPESRKQLEAFTRGVNRFLKDGGDTIAIYQGYHVQPEPWRVEDCFLTAEVMGLAMTISSFFEEYYLERLRREKGEPVRDLFVPTYPEGGVIITRDEPMLSMLTPFFPKPLEGLGSNNWAISGRRTVSGLPLIANDPHVPETLIPTFWWHAQVKAGRYDLMGMMFTGFPAFGAATTGKLSWTLTNVMADYIDVWREKINPQNPDEYQVDGAWKPLIKEDGEVKVRGKRPVPYTMRISRHGAVVDSKLLGWKVPTSPNEVLVARYVDLEMARWYRGYQAMALAQNFNEWLAGAKDEAWGPFAWNHTYADAEGNIAYWATAHFPIRKDNQGWIARQGWLRDQDWQGYAPFEENPHLVNPKKGYLVTANNRIETPGYPYYITVDYVSPSRATRITELIEQKDKLDVDDVKKIQYDVAVMSAREVVPLILSDLKGAKDPDLIMAYALLAEWGKTGYLATVDSRGTCVYQVFMDGYASAVFEDELGDKTAYGSSLAGLLDAGLEKIISDPDSVWFDDIRTPAKETRREITQRVIKETMKYLQGQMGRDAVKWQWGELNRIGMYLTLIPMPGTPSKYKLGRYPMAGASETVRAAGALRVGPWGFFVWEGPSTHFIVDFRDPRQAYFNCSAGMADNPQSDRYQNLTDAWLSGRYFTMSMDESAYRPGMMGEQTLAP